MAKKTSPKKRPKTKVKAKPAARRRGAKPKPAAATTKARASKVARRLGSPRHAGREAGSTRRPGTPLPLVVAAARILTRRPPRGELAARRAAAPAAGGFDRPATRAGATAHFQVYYQTGFANGPAIAAGVLATCERDYQAIIAFFAGLTPPQLPMNIVIAPDIGGAYHYGCDGVDLYCEGDTAMPPNIDLTRYVAVAEEVEVFEAAQNRGWDCGASNGEGLSRVLATELYPAQLDGFATAAAWLESARPDWVSRTEPTDQDSVSTGCAVLFLNYLRYQLRFPWPSIVATAGATLEATYQALTGRSGGFAPFTALLAAHFPPGKPVRLTTDNPFPLS